MSTPILIEKFYEQIWNQGDESAVTALLSSDFVFRGSLGDELVGRSAFWNYVCRVRDSLSKYRCEILECVAEDGSAFARMRFSGRHVGMLLGFSGTGKLVEWSGAALFHFSNDSITQAWVLGDLHGLLQLLEK